MKMAKACPQKCLSQWGTGYLLCLCVITLNIVNISAQWEHGDYIGLEQVLSACSPQVSRRERALHALAETGEAGWQPHIMTSPTVVGEQNLAGNWTCCWGACRSWRGVVEGSEPSNPITRRWGAYWESARNTTLRRASAKNDIISPQKGTTPTERSILSFSIWAVRDMIAEMAVGLVGGWSGMHAYLAGVIIARPFKHDKWQRQCFPPGPVVKNESNKTKKRIL